VRRLVAAGGLAIAACTCLLLFSGAASARQTTGDTINVTGVVTGTSANGTNVQFTATGSLFKAISFDGGSNWHFSKVSGYGWTCGLTPTNGGAYCTSPTAAASYTVNTTISGTPPTSVAGEVGYGDGSTGPFTASVAAAASRCHCTRVSAEFTGFHEEAGHHGYVLLFLLKWGLDCTSGSESDCQGVVDVPHLKQPLPHGLHLRYPPKSPNVISYANDKGIIIHCHPHKGTCEDTTGEQKFELIGHPQFRADLQMVFNVESRCVSGNGYEHKNTLTIKFDGQGQLDRRHSDLGKLS
jgi:hypothetical protein